MHVQIFAARPLYPYLRTTPMAGSKLTSHLRALLLTFGSYLPPPATLSSAANIPAASRATRVPQEVLTDLLVEEIKTRCCFVGHALDVSDADFRDMTPLVESSSEPPSSSVPSEFGQDSTTSSQAEPESDFSEATRPSPSPSPSIGSGDNYLQAMSSIYKRHSTATDLQMRVVPPPFEQTGTGLGTLIIPGWIRERTAEVLFEGGDIDESSVAEVILDSLLRVRNPQWQGEYLFYLFHF
jgi:actin-related protein 10